jgi:hypothetical protein
LQEEVVVAPIVPLWLAEMVEQAAVVLAQQLRQMQIMELQILVVVAVVQV